MGFWLDLLIGLLLASCFQHISWPLTIFFSLGSIISAFTYWSPHSGVTSDSSSNMENASAFCDLSSYWSYCDVSSTLSSTKSLSSMQGPSFWCRDAINDLCSALHSSHSHSSWVGVWHVDLWRILQLSLIILPLKRAQYLCLDLGIYPVWSSHLYMVLFHLKHYPFEPFKLTKLANVRHLTEQNAFRNLPIQFVDVVCIVVLDTGLKFKAVISKSLSGARLNELPTQAFLWFLYFFVAFDH